MKLKWKFFKVIGNAITGYFAGLTAVSLGDADIGFKMLQSLFASAVLAGIAIGRVITDAGENGKI